MSEIKCDCGVGIWVDGNHVDKRDFEEHGDEDDFVLQIIVCVGVEQLFPKTKWVSQGNGRGKQFRLGGDLAQVGGLDLR